MEMLNPTYFVPLHLDFLEPSGAPQIPPTLAHRSDGKERKAQMDFFNIKVATS